MGDGINDSSSLMNSDIGISVDTAVDIAKESADIILLEKDLNVLLHGVEEGRRTFGNLMKYIKTSVSFNYINSSIQISRLIGGISYSLRNSICSTSNFENIGHFL